MFRRFALALTALSLGGCYVTRMALHHNDLFNTRRPVSEVIQDPATAPLQRTRLIAVERILAFATSSGLTTNGAYLYFIETKEPVVSYIVQAAHADRLEFVTWWFPVVGSVPYIGFFAKAERDAKAEEMRSMGYDVSVSGAGAFSSLGWFDDPIFSSMLNRGDADLAHLFFHELTHRTLWVPGTVEFNENLAEYVASDLTHKYLEASGQQSLLAGYDARLGDKLLFRRWLMQLKEALAAVYESFKVPEGTSSDALFAQKKVVIASFLAPPKKPAFAATDYVAADDWNNASILGAALYAPDLERFAAAHLCVGGTVEDFLAALKLAMAGLDSGESSLPAFKALDNLCEAKHVDR